MVRGIVGLARWAVILAASLVAAIFLVRAVQSQRGEPLRPWHLTHPPELDARAIDGTDWQGYLAAEDAAFRSLDDDVTAKLSDEDRVPFNRYNPASALHRSHFATDWNRTFILDPAGPPRGAAVLVHGLTDSPYSMRALARLYRDRGFVAIAVRMPGHGTVPGGLVDVRHEDWSAATRLAMREARRRVGPAGELHIVGYSNGGALAVKYALNALDDPHLPRPDRIVLLSPMIGVTRFARFAGLAGLPALFPRFAKAAWLDVSPEFNPFKYTSFPVNGGRQSYLLSSAVQEEIAAKARDGRLVRMPPVLAFQSVMDSTVSTPAIVDALFSRLPSNGSELVLFDLNRSAALGPLLRSSAQDRLDRLLPPAPRRYAVSIVTNASPATLDAVERRTPADAVADATAPIGLAYAPGLYSLSHVALPFPVDDPLYGLQPDRTESFGIALGTLAPRGERGVLITSLDALMRITSNPFFPYVAARVGAAIDADAGAPQR